ncbi:MAG: cation-transporting P-type ATPase, partial [Eubacteriales bacterium]
MKYRNDWHLRKAEDVLTELESDMYQGLSEKEAARRRRKYGANRIWHVKRVSALEAVWEALFDVVTLLLVVSAAAAALFDKSGEAVAVTVLLVIGGVLRSVVYVRASRILENMAEGFIPTATVIRDGRMKLLPAGEIVPGDIVFLESGSTVPCDGRVVAGEDSVVSERGITENSAPVHKFDMVIDTDADGGEVPCECRSNILFAGSVVLSGSLRMVATACGMRSLIGMKQEGIVIEPSDKLPLVEKLEGWCKFTSLVMLACVMVITVLSLFCREGFTLPDIFLTTMAMSVAAMSEYLAVIGYIIIAASVHRCANGSVKTDENKKKTEIDKKQRTQTLIRRPSELETMAGVGRIVFCGSSFFASGRAEIFAYRVNGTYYAHAAAENDRAGLGEMISLAVPAASTGQSGRSLSKGTSETITERARAVQTAAGLCASLCGAIRKYPILDHVDSSNVFAAGLDTSLIACGDEVFAVSCGGIAEVLRACTSFQTAQGVRPLDTEARRQIFTECASLEYIGAKIAAVAKHASEYTTLNRLAVVTQDMTFVGFFAVAEEPEKRAAENAAYLKREGIVPILLSSEPERDLYYCHDIGLMGKKTKVVPYTELDAEDVRSLSPYGMIVAFPEQKYGIPASAKADVMKKIMNAEREPRPVTAAVGREVSDVDVLRQADVGFAVAGSSYRSVPEPLSRQAAAVVCPAARTGQGGLDGILCAVQAAGQAVRNIKTAAFYLTAAQIARLAVILTAVLLPAVPLLDEVTILVWGLLFDFAAVLVMAFEHEEDAPRVKEGKTGKFLPIRIRSAVLAGLAWGLSPAMLVILMSCAASFL